jgi:hypothetical protein
MNREDLEHLIRAAATVTNEYEFVIVGSQSILGPIPYPPAELRMSAEADMYPLNAEEKSILIEGSLGEGSQFHTSFGYYAQGVDSHTAILPEGWKNRLQRVQNEATEGKVGYCLDVLDLFMAKLVANREKDREFNMALLHYGYVKTNEAIDMVVLMPVNDATKRDMRARIRRWAKALKERGYEFSDG